MITSIRVLLGVTAYLIFGLAHADSDDGLIKSGHEVKHVLLISVDGLHALDLSNYVATHPDSTLAKLESSWSDLQQQFDIVSIGFISRAGLAGHGRIARHYRPLVRRYLQPSAITSGGDGWSRNPGAAVLARSEPTSPGMRRSTSI